MRSRPNVPEDVASAARVLRAFLKGIGSVFPIDYETAASRARENAEIETQDWLAQFDGSPTYVTDHERKATLAMLDVILGGDPPESEMLNRIRQKFAAQKEESND